MKKNIKTLASICLFIILFCVGFKFVSDLVRYKDHGTDTTGQFYKQKKNTIDVLFLGSSEAYSTFSPMQIWNETGITSYNLSTSSQSLPTSYYLLREGIRTQHPKVVVLEVYTAYYERDYHSTARLHQAVDAIPLNKTKFDMMKDYLSRTLTWEEQIEYAFPIIQYHSRIYDLKKPDYNNNDKYLRGYLVRKNFEKRKEPAIVEEKEELYDLHQEYLQKMVDLCKEEGVELIFCKTPVSACKTFESKMKKYNQVEAFAQENGITYFNFNRLAKDIDLDYSVDFYDDIHLNTNGAEKVTGYIAEYLKNNCDLTDHRKDDNFSNWNEDYIKYQKTVDKAKATINKRINEANK